MGDTQTARRFSLDELEDIDEMARNPGYLFQPAETVLALTEALRTNHAALRRLVNAWDRSVRVVTGASIEVDGFVLGDALRAARDLVDPRVSVPPQADTK